MNEEACEPVASAIRGRRSIRRFQDRPIARATMERLLEAASWAPSPTNRQDWFFSVVESPGVKAEMARAVRARWRDIVEDHRHLGAIEDVERYAARFADFERAPVVVVVSAAAAGALDRELAGDLALTVAGSIAAAAMAAQNLMLTAHALGLGTCCMTGGLVASAEIRGLLELGRRREPVCLIAVGYPDEEPAPPPRRPLDEIVRYW